MICVYPADCTDFSTNGNGTLAPLSAEVTETLNGEYELTLVHPIDEAGKWQRLVEGCILRAPVPAAMTPRVNFSAPGDDGGTEVWRINTDFSGAQTRKGTLRLRSGPGTKYKTLASYKNGSFVQVIAKTNSSWYEVTAPDGKHGYFTVLSNLLQGAASLVYAVCLARALRGGRAVPHGVTLLKYAATASVGLTFLTVMGFLGPLFGYASMFRGANFWFHLIVPLAAAFDFCLLDREGTLSRRESLLAVLPTLLYGAGYVGNILAHGVGAWPDTNDWYGFLVAGPVWGAVIAAAIPLSAWGLALLLRLPRRQG